MGYHVSITRETSEKKSDITEQEWRNFVTSSDQISFESYPADTKQDKIARSMLSAAWNKDEQSWLGYSNGEIWTKNPTDEFLRYMIEIAPLFKARVRGDDGEYYRSFDDYYYEEGGNTISRQEKQAELVKAMQRIKQRRLFWNLLRIAIMIAVFFMLLKNLKIF